MDVVTPYTNAYLPAAPNVTNVVLQNQCPLDQSDHLEIASDPVAMADMLNALDPAHPVKAPASSCCRSPARSAPSRRSGFRRSDDDGTTSQSNSLI